MVPEATLTAMVLLVEVRAAPRVATARSKALEVTPSAVPLMIRGRP